MPRAPRGPASTSARRSRGAKAGVGTIDHHLPWLVWEAFQFTRRSIDDVVRAEGVTAPQLGILGRLADQPGLSGAELARQLLITPQAAHVALQTLERKGLIERKPGPDGGRAIRSVLTEAGRRTVEACRAEWGDVERRLVDALTPDERATLAHLLNRYVHHSSHAAE